MAKAGFGAGVALLIIGVPLLLGVVAFITFTVWLLNYL